MSEVARKWFGTKTRKAIIAAGFAVGAVSAGVLMAHYMDPHDNDQEMSAIQADKACEGAVAKFSGHVVSEKVLGAKLFQDCGFTNGTDQLNGAIVNADVRLPSMSALNLDIQQARSYMASDTLTSGFNLEMMGLLGTGGGLLSILGIAAADQIRQWHVETMEHTTRERAAA